MAEIINMPRLSDTMEEGTVATWFKKVGDTINEGDILAEIETDKATMEFEAFYAGELLHIGIQEGGTAPVDTLLAIIGEKGEDISAHLNGGAASEEKEVAAAKKVEEVSNEKVALPDNVEIITMPRLSDTMEEGTVASWLKKVGDEVAEGDILAEIETDKATMEFESFYNGTLLHVGIQEGESAPVDSVLAIIGAKDADVKAAIASLESAPAPVTEAPKETTSVAPPKTETPKPVASTPVAAPAVVNTNGRVIASPLAKKLAEEKGINLSSVAGTGDGGRIIKRDIENYQPSVGGGVRPFVPSGVESVEEVANSQMRKTIAKRLAGSKFTAPHYYLGVEFDMDNAIAFRAQFNSIPDTKISFNDIVVKATALALKKHPQVNSRWHDDKIVKHNHVHMGVAVAVEDGLVVPVVKFADEQSLPQIGTQVRDYAGRARDKKLTPAEMDGSTFTISNLGMFGIQEFTSIINQPNSAILSVGAIVQKPVVKNGQIVVGNMMKLTLACDHRSVDGATGSQFLQTLQQYIENPLTMLL
ncbi:pyruvate dehydrogenase complex dihydrolipoamide acetyltransferase [Flavobacteriaceae bacterium]|uniref:pyruvate dehydrogenase complex dihydrolipoamide acetyltransferase n=1 Tax=Candidatus Arcticimaribacter forsetii TaxID=2820661 RepID=UPI0020776830|nr:pyruvate dehydrogenase complex dihydrolipoamide acetyltransferase [Candidatus Arcticimaribacter forsetii]MDA8698775.1 pyruvate dehydrogenase complex dihydrolipoamide acetyltransferase [Flavobacteriaceae bacterium]MDB2325786.1 pyruvate dehydrogenase complex dihydrolipoamide acetyltransferase [Flavobacteriaceae bacterium]MDB4674712.1 pyruvate dehydrogenase complex dihydrolipoamide acetyltransferase [Flavobacteriaceae bacterium]MDB4716950.1 pyruvate dehydrogenase complex dihydrolipoamide acetyl